MRSGELLALTGNDIDLQTKVVNINKTYVRLKGVDLIQEPKTPKSKRKVTIPTFMAEIIEEYIDMLVDYNPNDRLFEVTRGYLTCEMKRGFKRSGVKKIRVHDLRHSHASLLIEMGFSPLLISERLGHEEIQTTLQTYSHLYPNKQYEVSDKLEQL
ncbi:MAG: site-specific integrase [Clostridia bacterium]